MEAIFKEALKRRGVASSAVQQKQRKEKRKVVKQAQQAVRLKKTTDQALIDWMARPENSEDASRIMEEEVRLELHKEGLKSGIRLAQRPERIDAPREIGRAVVGYDNLLKPELQALAREKGIDARGTKGEIMRRLREHDE
jgi:hypothetical protein